jgi:hypothetical protein
MTEGTSADNLMNRLRSGYLPTEAEATAWNVEQTVHGLRGQITQSDLSWIMPSIAKGDDSRTAFYLALLQPLGAEPEVRAFLTERFESASPYLKAQLLWRLLDDAALSEAAHAMLFAFVMSNWELFQASCVAYLGDGRQILQAVLRRFGECPASKRWVYLCCLPGYADDQQAVKGLLTITAASADAFMAKVADSLLERFFAEADSVAL